MAFWNIFKKKPKLDTKLPADVRANMTLKQPDYSSFTQESTGNENVRAKMDLALTQMESMNIRLETLNQRMERLERMVQEIWTIAKA